MTNNSQITADPNNLLQTQQQIRETISKRNALSESIANLQNNLSTLENNYFKKQSGFLNKLFTKKETVDNLASEIEDTRVKLNKQQDLLNSLTVNIDNLHSNIDETQYTNLISLFEQLGRSNKIWNIVSTSQNTETKSSAKNHVDRKEVSFSTTNLDALSSKFKALYLKNLNGPDLFLYPTFLLQFTNGGDILLTDIKQLSFNFRQQRFIEPKISIPSDSKIIDSVWKRVNKDGSPDLRFKGNYQTPVVRYGLFEFSNFNGLDTVYHISNYEIAEHFAKNFQKIIKSSSSAISNISSSFEIPKTIISFLDFDPSFVEAAQLIVETQIGSTSLIQRRLKFGYNRAGKIMDELEAAGIVGKINGATIREVLVKDLNTLWEIVQNIKDNTNFSNPAPIIKKNDFEFTQQYYNLLTDFNLELKSISINLSKDKVLIEKLKGSLGTTTQHEFIPYCVIYDLCQIAKALNNGNYDKGALETTGLILSTNKILPEIETDLLGAGYETVALSHSKGLYNGVAKSIIDIGNNSNPLNIDITHIKNNEVKSNKKFQGNLSLLNALKINDHPLFDEYASLLYRFANIIAKADNRITKEEENRLKEIYQIIHNPIPEEMNKSLIVSNSNESFEDILEELDSLIGLDRVKQEIKTLINFIKVQKVREEKGLKSSSISYHMVFTGNPGTGKTTVARIVAKIYKALGILSEGQLVETDRSGLIAEYVGQTAIKVNKIVDSAINGVLFIDEAYSIAGDTQNDFGKEAIATLIKRMEDDRDKLIVVVAGYTNEMNTFIETNPGFKSRFNRYVEFTDYSPQELFDIYQLQCSKLDYKLTDDAKQKLKSVFEKAYYDRNNTFGNGRFVRNIFEKSLERQANRIASVNSLDKETLTTITIYDIP